ncbi:hypothetical protein RLW55_14735 [Hyphomicrobium sp. B1]|uniref:hypothetical protein n=1 Tax=Hyphomicrobium sp. B1 TaxID=3075651 RepID=UPI003C2F0EB7
MIKRAILHIGGEKTGSTTLQRFLTRNAALLKQAGFFYPCASNDICFEHDAHFPVAGALIDGEVEFVSAKRQPMLPSVLAHLAQSARAANGNLILSCEHFSSRITRLQQLQKLRDALPTDDIKIVFYAREPSELALASWSESIRNGSHHRFSADQILPQARFFNHLQTLDLWAEAFGRSNLIVREYDRTQMADGDIRRDFCEQLGVEITDPLLDDDRNISLDLQRLEVLRHLNEALPKFSECADGWRRAQCIRVLVTEFIPEGEPLGRLLSKHESNAIKARFSEVTQELNRRYFDGRLSRKWFPQDNPADPEPNSVTALQEAEVIQALVATITRMAERTSEDGTSHAVGGARAYRKRRLRNTRRKLKQALQVTKQRLLAPFEARGA